MTGPITILERIAALKEIRAQGGRESGYSALLRFEQRVRRATAAPPLTAQRAVCAPNWMRADLLARELTEAELALVELTLELDSASVREGGPPLEEICGRHTEACTLVRRLRARRERKAKE